MTSYIRSNQSTSSKIGLYVYVTNTLGFKKKKKKKKKLYALDCWDAHRVEIPSTLFKD